MDGSGEPAPEGIHTQVRRLELRRHSLGDPDLWSKALSGEPGHCSTGYFNLRLATGSKIATLNVAKIFLGIFKLVFDCKIAKLKCN